MMNGPAGALDTLAARREKCFHFLLDNADVVIDGNSEPFLRRRPYLLQVKMTRATRGSIQVNESPALQDSVQDSGGQILVVEHLSPLTERLVGGKDHGPFLHVAMVDHMEQGVSGIRSVGQIS